MFDVDINSDGIADFTLKEEGGSSSHYYGYLTKILPIGLNEIAYGEHDTGIAVGACSPRVNIVPRNFVLNDSIKNDLVWMDTTMIFASISQGYIPPACLLENTGIQGNDKYIGVRLINSIDTTYGWIHFESINNSSLKLMDYACEVKTDSINISQNLNDTLVDCGSSFSLKIKANSSGSCLNYQWSKGGISILGATSDSLYFNYISISDSGNYSCRVSSAFDTIIESSKLRVQIGSPVAPGISVYPNEIWGCEGEYGYKFWLEGDLSNVISYQWTKNGVDIPGADSSVINIGALKLSDAGNYSCKLIAMLPIYCPDSIIPWNFESTTAIFDVKHKPVPIITQVGNKLISNYNTGNAWYFQDSFTFEYLSSDPSINMVKEGQYLVVVNDDYCIGSTNFKDYYFEFKLTPNPFENEIIVSLKREQLYTSWELVNDLGITVLKGSLTSIQNTINTSTITKGHYYLKINGQVMKMIKQ